MDTLLISVYEASGVVRELGEVEDTGLVLAGGEAVLTGVGARQLQVLLAADLKRFRDLFTKMDQNSLLREVRKWVQKIK